MTPNNIAGMAALKGLNLLALTDHNSCKNCPAFFEACRRQWIVPVAGMELSTAEDIHLVCLFEFLEDAMRFDEEISRHLLPMKNRVDIFGNQWIMNGEDELVGEEETLLISATDLLIDDAVQLARSFGAHVRPAHVDREANGIVAILGTIPEEYAFSCFEFHDAEQVEEYRKRFPKISAESVLVCSDAHRLWEINEAEYALKLADEPYSSALVRKRLFEYLNRLDNHER